MASFTRPRRFPAVWAGLMLSLAGPIAVGATGLPRYAEYLLSYQPAVHLSGDQIDILVTRWFAQIKPDDVDGSIAAIEFLRTAPDVFATPAVEKRRDSDRLGKVFEAADSQQKSWLRNS